VRARKIIVVFLFFIASNVVEAQSVDRPLRTVPPSPSSTSSLLPSTSSLLPSQNSLLSAAALGHPLTQRYIAEYSSPGGIAWLRAVMERGSIYLPFIREEISRRGLPPELLYLPVIESGFLSTARSRSGAVGLWQFMMNSIAGYDMKVNDFLDERRDFIKSTKGALQKLEDNYKTLNDWPLALAAYNVGLGAVNRTIQRTRVRDYWELCEKKELRAETINYVPKLLAAAHILSQGRRYNIDLWLEYAEWTTIPLERQVSLEVLASQSGTDRELLRRMNAELLLGISPPDKNHLLKVPVSRLSQINQVLQDEDNPMIHYHRYTIVYGDTLSALSRHYGVPLNIIEQHNPGILNRYLRIGETIIIPAWQERPAYTQERPAASQSDALSFEGNHLVKRGETLWSLAIAYEVDPQTLAEVNGMELNQILSEGRSLKVPIRE